MPAATTTRRKPSARPRVDYMMEQLYRAGDAASGETRREFYRLAGELRQAVRGRRPAEVVQQLAAAAAQRLGDRLL